MIGRTNAVSRGSVQIPLEACTAFSASAGNAQVKLTWTDPKDKYATPEGETAQDSDQLVSEWDHTILVRKTGSQPAGPIDGTVVVSSSMRDQYKTSAYVDSGLVNDITYYYGVFAYNKDGVASPGVFVTTTPTAGTPLSELAVGALIKINENGAPVEYMIVNQGLPSSRYDASCDGCWILRKDIGTKWVWNSSEWNDYKNGEIHAYLNSIQPYLNEGWLSRYSAGVLSQIKQVKIPYQNGTGSGGSVAFGANGLSCKIFLLSGYEVGLAGGDSRFPYDGAKLSYFSSGTSSYANNYRIAKYNGSATDWWLRSPNTDGDGSVWTVNSNGSGLSRGSYATCGVRPALILPSTITVDENMNVIA